MNKYAENLRRNCGFQRAAEKGLSNYPYGEHLQDCDICQGAEEIESMQARIELLELSEELAWGLIANAFGGDWDIASDEWKKAAKRWRDKYNAALQEQQGDD